MDLAHRRELTKQAPLAPEYAETSTYFHGGNGDGEDTVAGEVHKILALTLVCFDRWLKPLFSDAERQSLSPIQEHDPYVGVLLRYHRSQVRNRT
jgi:hypothetical protein